MYMVKYALSCGGKIPLLTFEDLSTEGRPRYLRIDGDGRHVFPSLPGHDVASTRELAEARFEELKAKRLKSLEKQIAKIRAMKPKFE